MTYKELKKLIDESYELEQEIKWKEAQLKANKAIIKLYASKRKKKEYAGNKHSCIIFNRPYGSAKPLKVWNACKGNKKLFFDLIKVLVTKLEDTFDEKTVKKLVEYKDVTCISFRE